MGVETNNKFRKKIIIKFKNIRHQESIAIFNDKQ